MSTAPALLIDLHYLPSIAYFACLLPYETIQLEAHEHYQKQTYRNRCYILTSQGIDRLTVPVRHSSGIKTPYQRLEIDYSQPWIDRHWRALCTAYRKAPYFEYFAASFHDVWAARHPYLFDLNFALLQTCLALLQMEKRLEVSTRYEKIPGAQVVDARGHMHPRHRLETSSYFQPTPYLQVFENGFQPNLSILDLLFCEGANARAVLQQSIVS